MWQGCLQHAGAVRPGLVVGGLAVLLLAGCAGGLYRTYGETAALISAHTTPVILADGPRQVLITPEFAGRVMISTFDGDGGLAMGWIDPQTVSGARRDPQFVNYGAADRLWLSPEGGQYALYFKPGAPFTFDQWVVPEAFNHSELPLRSRSETEVVMGKPMELTNWSGTKFKLDVERTVSLIDAGRMPAELGAAVPEGVKYVAYKTRNVMRNVADTRMTREGGLISLWILGMFTTEGHVLVICPYVPDAQGGSGPIVKDDYFGKVPPSRLQVLDDPPVVLFKGDGRLRSKIGLSATRTTGVMASIDFRRLILTITRTPGIDPEGLYASNAWEMQDAPFVGDAVNSYNDDGGFGPMYELETLSPVRELAPAEALVHEHVTAHFQGPLSTLNEISRRVMGVDLTALPRL